MPVSTSSSRRRGQTLILWIVLVLACASPMVAVLAGCATSLRQEARLLGYDLALTRALAGALAPSRDPKPGIVAETFQIEDGARSRVVSAREGDHPVSIVIVETGRGVRGFRIAYGTASARAIAKELWLAWKQAQKDAAPVHGNLPLARLTQCAAVARNLEPADREKLRMWAGRALPATAP